MGAYKWGGGYRAPLRVLWGSVGLGFGGSYTWGLSVG